MKLFGLVVLTARQYREERDADTAVAASLILKELDRVRMELDRARLEAEVLRRLNMILKEQVADLTAKLAALPEVKAETPKLPTRYRGPAYQAFLSSAVEEFRRKFLAANANR